MSSGFIDGVVRGGKGFSPHTLPITDDSEAIVLSEGSTLADICLLPADVGPCRAAKPRYYYDIEAKACVKFRYGGCYGNCNNFATVEKCETSCPTKIKSFRMENPRHHVTREEPIWEEQEDWSEYLPEEEWSSFEPEPDRLDYPILDRKNTLRVSGRPVVINIFPGGYHPRERQRPSFQVLVDQEEADDPVLYPRIIRGIPRR
uniref:BPTI/Kunitz inhibitor domain-containing protein n=1 Tax=Timema shepardi TaxID=629360 RepID=A0A7R9G4B8_TIMSH|nr:unnamed protein product [Timema shepardi]